MTMVVPFASVPISSALTAFQIFAAIFRDPDVALIGGINKGAA
jgi:hypothetical protein